MRVSILSTILLLLLPASLLYGQKNVYPDTLKIFDDKFLEIEIISGFIDDSDHEQTWVTLLSDFEKHLRLIIAEVPSYDNYFILYQQGKSLEIEEITGKRRYQVDKEGTLKIAPDNRAILKNDLFHIILHFGDVSALLQNEFVQKIKSAIVEYEGNSHKPGPRTSKASLTYSFPRSKQIANKSKAMRPASLLFGVGASIGILSNRPVYEYGLGVGVRFNGPIPQDLYLYGAFQHQFNEFSGKLLTNKLLGINFRPSNYFGLEIAMSFGNQRMRENLRFGVSVFPIKGLSITPVYYTQSWNTLSVSNIGINFGYGI